MVCAAGRTLRRPPRINKTRQERVNDGFSRLQGQAGCGQRLFLGHGRGDRKAAARARRSEEHTSELQSLMRISYAVFCLNNKTNSIKENNNINLKQQNSKTKY